MRIICAFRLASVGGPAITCIKGSVVRPLTQIRLVWRQNVKSLKRGEGTFPRIIAPDLRSFAAMVESRGTLAPRRAKDPAVLFIRSKVAMLFLMSTGMPL